MKLSKKLLSILLVLVMLVGMIPVTAGAEGTQSVSAEAGEVGVEGTNSFGSLLSDAITDSQEAPEEDEYTGQYSVTALKVTGNMATVTYEALEEATLLVAVYSEDGLQLITTGKTTVSPEETEAEVTIEGTMPEYFEVSAYLLDEQDVSPLCKAYTSPMYTQEMQQLLSSTIYDYDPELVLNLDESESTNFAVYKDGVVIIEPIEGVNTVAVSDDENRVYVFENADSQITSLTPGTIFTYEWTEEDILIAKVDSLSLNGTTATVIGSELTIDEVFDCLKLETSGDTSDVIVDASDSAEGITYVGLVDEEDKPATRAWEGDVNLKKKSLGFKLSIFAQEGEQNSVGASVTGDFKLTAYPKLEYYISWKRQHVEVTADLVGELDVTFTGSLKREGQKLASLTFPSPVAGITFTAEPKLVLQFDMTAKLSTVMTMTVGFGYDSSDGVLNLCTKPEIDMESSMEGSLFFGIEFEASAEIIKKSVASIGFTITGGVRITGKMTGTNHEPPPKETASKKHTCEDCLSLRFDQVREFSVWLKLINCIKIEKTLKSTQNHLFDMYWSMTSDNTGLGFGKCPNYVYRVTVKVQDKAGDVTPNQEIFLSDGTSLGKTNEKGILPKYLEADEYTFVTTIGEETIKVTRKVTNATKVVMTNNPEILSQLAALENLLISALNIEIHDTYIAGEFSSGVTWKLYRSGQLIVEGDGAMDYYSSFSKTPWCNFSAKIKEVEIKEGVTNVGSYAFSGCSNLKKVVLADSVKNIGNYAFRYCSGITEIRLPVDYQYQAYSFDKCTGVQKIQYGYGAEGVMPNRNDSYDSNYYVRNSLEFMCGESLQTVIFEEGITNIGNYAFFGAESLQNVYFPESMTEIGSYSFRYSGVEKLELPEGLISIGSSAFWNSQLTEIELPDSMQSIGYEAFARCYDLTEVVIPDSLSSGIGRYAFYNCTALTKVTVPVDYQLCTQSSFYGCSSVDTIHYTPGATGIMTDRSSSSSYEQYYRNSLEYICRNSLKSVTFDEGITRIGNYAFYENSTVTTPVLKYVELPSTLESIGWYAFYHTDLTSIELPEGLISIEYRAFYGSDFTEIQFPDSLTTIGYQAFACCYNLTELEIPDHLCAGLGDGAFYNCSGLRRITVPVDYKLYSGGIFTGCYAVEEIHYTPGDTGVMPDRSSSSSYDAYYRNTLEYACRNSLKTVIFDAGITRIGDYAFYENSTVATPLLERVVLPSTLESIGWSAFYCTDLTSIVFPASLESIEYRAFYRSKLSSITFTGDAPTIGNDVFNNVTAIVCYPSGNATWTDSVMQNYGGTLTWVAMDISVPAAANVAPTSGTAQSVSPNAVVTEKEKPANRAIFAGEYDAVELDDRIVHTARFSGLVAGEEYVMFALLSDDAEDLLTDSNIIAIKQGTAEEDGTLVFDYVQRQQANVSYVFVAGPSNQNIENAEITFPDMSATDDLQTVEPVVTYNGKVLTEEVDYIIIGQVDYAEPGDYTCYIRGVRAFTGLVECHYTVKEISVTGWSLSLGDSVGVNFYVTVGDDLVEDSVVSVSIDGETTLYPVSDALWDKNTECYRFSLPIAAAQMTQPVTVELIVEDEVISTKTYTVRQYAEYILDDNNGYDDGLKSLVKALLNYGAASQDYFDYYEDNLANAGYETGTVTPIPAEIPEVDVVDELTGCGYYGASLLFYGELTVRFYFKISRNTDNLLIYQLRNQPELQTKDGLHYVDLSGICPQDLDKILYLWIIDDDGQMMIGYSPMHYIARMYHNEKSSETLKNLLQALYDYHLAAIAYCE